MSLQQKYGSIDSSRSGRSISRNDYPHLKQKVAYTDGAQIEFTDFAVHGTGVNP